MSEEEKILVPIAASVIADRFLANDSFRNRVNIYPGNGVRSFDGNQYHSVEMWNFDGKTKLGFRHYINGTLIEETQLDAGVIFGLVELLMQQRR